MLGLFVRGLIDFYWGGGKFVKAVGLNETLVWGIDGGKSLDEGAGLVLP